MVYMDRPLDIAELRFNAARRFPLDRLRGSAAFASAPSLVASRLRTRRADLRVTGASFACELSSLPETFVSFAEAVE